MRTSVSRGPSGLGSRASDHPRPDRHTALDRRLPLRPGVRIARRASILFVTAAAASMSRASIAYYLYAQEFGGDVFTVLLRSVGRLRPGERPQHHLRHQLRPVPEDLFRGQLPRLFPSVPGDGLLGNPVRPEGVRRHPSGARAADVRNMSICCCSCPGSISGRARSARTPRSSSASPCAPGPPSGCRPAIWPSRAGLAIALLVRPHIALIALIALAHDRASSAATPRCLTRVAAARGRAGRDRLGGGPGPEQLQRPQPVEHRFGDRVHREQILGVGGIGRRPEHHRRLLPGEAASACCSGPSSSMRPARSAMSPRSRTSSC